MAGRRWIGLDGPSTSAWDGLMDWAGWALDVRLDCDGMGTGSDWMGLDADLMVMGRTSGVGLIALDLDSMLGSGVGLSGPSTSSNGWIDDEARWRGI